MAQTIKLKRSSVAGNIPGSSDLALGEIAVNTADGALYIKKGDNTIVAVGDNDILHIDTSNGRVGVGTTSPSADLTVSGTIANDAFTIPNSIGSSGQVLKAPSSGTTLTWADESGSSGAIAPSINTMTGDGSTTTLVLSTTPVNENATIITFDGVLQHKSTYSLSGSTITFSAAPANGVAVECIVINTHSIQALEDGDSDTKIQVEETADEDKIRFDTAGTERMIIDASGNVGIGTTSPDAKLDISVAKSATRPTIGAGTQLLIESTANTSAFTAMSILGGNSSGASQINLGDVNDENVGQIGYYHADNSMRFVVNANERARIDSSGNVGIGTTSPSDKLSISSGSNQIGLDTGDISTYGTLDVGHFTNGAFIGTQSGSNAASDSLRFGTSGTTRMTLNSSGNLVFPDNGKAIFGAGSDLQIYHDGSNSYIKDAGTGSLRLRGTDLRLESSSLAHNFILCTEGGSVTLYHNDSAKLSTTSTGVVVTGTLTATTLAGTLSTAAQTNITSVGTLTSLNTSGDVTITSTDAGSSAGPIINLVRDSASPADADYLGQIKFKGENDNGASTVYSKITGKIDDASNGSEDGIIEFATQKAGTSTILARLKSSALALLNGTIFEGDLTGNVTGNVSGTASTVTTAAQPNITSLGTLTTLTVDDITINDSTISDAGDLTVDAGGDIILDADGGDVKIKDGGTVFGGFSNFLGSLVIRSGASDNAMIIGSSDGSVIMGGSVSLGNNNKLKFGTGSPLELYHDGSNSYISDVGTGNLLIGTDGTNIKLQGGSEDMIVATKDGAVELYHDGTKKAETTATGIDVTGALTATTKSFDIEHPSKEGMRLHHGVVEGPEHSVYVRGKSKEKVILLPDYWVDLIHEDTITIQLTAIGTEQDLYVEDIKDNKVFVNGDNYFYYIQAERKDVDRFEVEYEI
mgnify:CR=1 FL=1